MKSALLANCGRLYRDDPENAVSVHLRDDKGARVDSIHIHKDGSSKQKAKKK